MSQKTVIAGGGITGLTLAYLLASSGRHVTLVETSPHTGGLLRGFPVAGTRLEKYYHHFFTHDAELLWLLKSLQIDHKAHFYNANMGIYRDGRLRAFSGPKDLLYLPFLSWPSKLKFALTSLLLSEKRDWKEYENVPALAWLRKNAGSQVVNTIWGPLFKIKFGKYAERISLSWLIGRLSQRARSRKGTQGILGYLEGSFEIIIEALEKKCRDLGVQIFTGQGAESIARESSQFIVKTLRESLYADEVVLTQPLPDAKMLLAKPFPEFAATLADIEYFGAVCVILELKHTLSPYYWTNVCDPNFPFGGIIEHTNLMPKTCYQNRSLIYLSRYFTQDEAIASQSEDQIKYDFQKALEIIFPSFQQDNVISTSVFRTRHAAPVCLENFSRQIPNIKTQIPGLYIANMAHVYPDERSTNNAIRVAAETARCMNVNVSHIPKSITLAGQIGT